MKPAVLLFVFVAFVVIYEVNSTVNPSDVPAFMAKCLKFYHKKTDLKKTAAGAIYSMCRGFYEWFESQKLNPKRKASPQAVSFIKGLFHDAKHEILQHKVRRQKRQAGLPMPGPPAKLRVRKEIRAMKKQELRLFFEAVNSAKMNTSIAPNKYDALAEFHTGMSSVSAHGGCNFHGWHRMYILMFENALREEHPRFRHVTVPYMDSRMDNDLEDPTLSAIFSDRLMGSCQGQVTGGIMGKDGWDSDTGFITRTCGTDGPLMNYEMVRNVTRQRQMKDICGEDSLIYNDCEFFHNGFHRFCGGQMATLQSSVYDPIFWLHHTFIDYVWEMFRQNQIANGINPETDYPDLPTTMGTHELQLRDAQLGFGDLLVIDGLSNMFTDEWYTYEEPPSCTPTKRDCGSIYLKCVVDHKKTPAARCVARTLEEVIEAEKPKPKPCPTLPPPPTWPPPTKPIPSTYPTTLGYTFPATTPYAEQYLEHNSVVEVTQRTSVQLINSVQNTFCMNGKSDINQWVYIPCKIIYRRPPNFTNYGSFPVENGKIMKARGDIYSPNGYSNFRGLRNADIPAKYDDCIEPNIPTTEIFVSSMGMNYEGHYNEVTLIDNRLAVTVGTAYIAVKRPMYAGEQVVALLHAQDKCGRACKPVCKVPGTEIFRPCSGAITVTGGTPLQFGNSFGDAVMDVWDFKKEKDCPQMTTTTMVVSFYCDFKADWMWPKHVPEVGLPPPTTAACRFGWGCIIRRPCNSLTQCKTGEIIACEKSCSLFARCLNNNFYVHRCRRNERFVPGKGCMYGSCDYKKSRKELKKLESTLTIDQRKRTRVNRRRTIGGVAG